MKHVETPDTPRHAVARSRSKPLAAPLSGSTPATSGAASEKAHAPQVRVAIPVYNGEQYIMETVESLLAQDYPNLRIIAINNASTDRTQALLEAIEDERFELRSFEDHLPITENWNRAFKAASSGDYLMLVSADDVLTPGAIRALVSALEQHPECDLAVGQVELRNELDEKVLFAWPTWRPDPGVISDLESYILENGFNLNLNATMFRQRAEPSYDSAWTLVADMDLFIQLGRSGKQAICLNEEVLLVRKHGASASSNAERIWDLTLEMLSQHANTSKKTRLYRHRMGRILLWLAIYLVHSRNPQNVQQYLTKYQSEVPWWVKPIILSIIKWPGLTRAPILIRSLVMRQPSESKWQQFFPPNTHVLALPNWKAPRLFIPARDPLQRWQRSAFYPAYKPAAKAFRFLIRAQATMAMMPTKRVPLRAWPLGEFTRDVLPQATSATVLIGTPGPNQKVTVQLWDDRNQIMGYLKYADKPIPQQWIRHEYSVLSNLPAGIGPLPLKFGSWADGKALLTTPLQGKQVPVTPTPDERLVAFSKKLVTGPPVPLELHPWVQAHQDNKDIAFYLETLSERSWPVVVQHGDFVPWNLILTPSGAINAYDWEYGTVEGFPFLDLAHYVLQVAGLFHHWDPAKAATYARTYLASTREFDLTPRQAHAVVGLAAYNTYHGFRAAGGRPGDSEMRWWRSIWEGGKHSHLYDSSSISIEAR